MAAMKGKVRVVERLKIKIGMFTSIIQCLVYRLSQRKVHRFDRSI